MRKAHTSCLAVHVGNEFGHKTDRKEAGKKYSSLVFAANCKELAGTFFLRDFDNGFRDLFRAHPSDLVLFHDGDRALNDISVEFCSDLIFAASLSEIWADYVAE